MYIIHIIHIIYVNTMYFEKYIKIFYYKEFLVVILILINLYQLRIFHMRYNASR